MGTCTGPKASTPLSTLSRAGETTPPSPPPLPRHHHHLLPAQASIRLLHLSRTSTTAYARRSFYILRQCLPLPSMVGDPPRLRPSQSIQFTTPSHPPPPPFLAANPCPTVAGRERRTRSSLSLNISSFGLQESLLRTSPPSVCHAGVCRQGPEPVPSACLRRPPHPHFYLRRNRSRNKSI